MRLRAIAAALSSFAAVETAGATEIYPTTVTLDRARPIASLRIRNDGKAEATYELSGLRWSQAEGRDVYSPDEDFVATPPFLTLGAGEEAIVRVGLLSTDAGDKAEKAYRLLISDVTPPSPALSTGLNVRVQILVPVFLEPASRDLSVRLAVAARDGEQLCITGENKSDSHAKMVWIADSRAPEKKVATHQYFLARSAVEFCLDAPPSLLSSPSLTIGLTSAYQAGVTPNEIRALHSDAASRPNN